MNTAVDSFEQSERLVKACRGAEVEGRAARGGHPPGFRAGMAVDPVARGEVRTATRTAASSPPLMWTLGTRRPGRR